MIKQTINGIEVQIIKVKNRFLILHGNEMYYTDKRPYTDQQIEELKRELENVRNETNILNLINGLNESIRRNESIHLKYFQ